MHAPKPKPTLGAIRQRMKFCPRRVLGWLVVIAALTSDPARAQSSSPSDHLLTGKAAMGDWTTDAPGVQRRITVDDLPPPSSNILAVNPPRVIRRPAAAELRAAPGFKIDLYASGF